jgi:alpha-mannosidase
LKTQKPTYHIISHTHWDREWYLTYEQFRYRLVELIDHLLDLLDQDPEYTYFHLDGQTIVIEDYLEIKPSQRERLERYIRGGKILIGPWYEQNDLFLTSAESTVRNLIEGIRTSRSLGGEMKIGYLPDHFGLIGQMPQIFRQAGLEHSVFGRGYDNQKHNSSLIHWRSPDGSEVNGIHMTHWYNNAQRLPDELGQLQHLFSIIQERERAVMPLPHYLLMNGVDHLEAQENLSVIIANLRELFGGENEFIQDTLPNYASTVSKEMLTSYEDFPVVEGELRDRDDYSILSGVLSSRIYLKQANSECHDLIEKWIEPLSTWCALAGLDVYDREWSRFIWKKYMQNHPHDSICGCSQDAVHDHMMDRYASVKEAGEELVGRKLTVLINRIEHNGFSKGDQKLLAVNTAQLESHSVQKTAIYFLEEDQVEDFVIYDELGNSMPYRIIDKCASRTQVLSPINLPGTLSVMRYDIEWRPIVPALGYAVYRVCPNVTGQHVLDITSGLELSAAQPPVLENEHLKVIFHVDGTFDLADKKTGRILQQLGKIEDSADMGNLYVYTELGTKEFWDSPVKWNSLIVNELYQECCYSFEWEIPIGLNATFTGRLDETVICNFTVRIRLDRDSEQLKVQMSLDNRAKDHRFRLVFPLQEQASLVRAGGQFDVVVRPWDAGQEYSRSCNAYPYWKWVAPDYNGHGIALFSKGLYEYEMIDEGRAIGLTLLRCTETINVREIIAHENDIQPKGQCIGNYTFELAIRPFSHESNTQLYQEAELFHQGIRTKLKAVDDERWIQGRAWVQDTQISGTFTRPDPNADKAKLPLSGTWCEISGKTMISAIKWAEDGQGPLIRLYNVENHSQEIQVKLAGELTKVVQTNLVEEPETEWNAINGIFTAEIGKKKIVTYRFL